jgi:hypothetical protein
MVRLGQSTPPAALITSTQPTNATVLDGLATAFYPKHRDNIATEDEPATVNLPIRSLVA